MDGAGAQLLHAAAARVITRYLRDQGMRDVRAHGLAGGSPSTDVDITYERLGTIKRVKVKADPYFGPDSSRTADRSKPYYRPDSGSYALEVVSHHVKRTPGWVFGSEADELFYYYMALDHTEDELRELLDEPDETFFPSLRVLRDDLSIMPMRELRVWASDHQEEYSSRPVQYGDHSVWYRLVPRRDLDSEIKGAVHVGPIYRA